MTMKSFLFTIGLLTLLSGACKQKEEDRVPDPTLPRLTSDSIRIPRLGSDPNLDFPRHTSPKESAIAIPDFSLEPKLVFPPLGEAVRHQGGVAVHEVTLLRGKIPMKVWVYLPEKAPKGKLPCVLVPPAGRPTPSSESSHAGG